MSKLYELGRGVINYWPKEELEKFVHYLDLTHKYGSDSNKGLCGLTKDYVSDLVEEDFTLNYSSLFHSMERFMDQCFEEWPYFSGDVCYPVPSPYEDMNDFDAFYLLNKWNNNCEIDNPYGKSREDLTLFVKNKLDELLKEM